MKNIKTLLIILLGYLSLSALGSDTLYVRFNNFYVKDGTPNDTLIFDVEYKSFTTGTYLTAFQLDINFNTAVFGTNALPVAWSNLELVSGGMTVQVGPVNPTTGSFRIGKSPLFPPYNPANFVLVPTTEWAGLMRFKMLVLDNNYPAGVQFNIAAMTNNQKFIKVVTNTMTAYAPIVAENDLINMPPTPTVFDLLFSEVADPNDSNGEFVEIYNAGDYDVDFSVFPWYLTAWDGVSYESVQLTGSIAAGETYVLGGSFFAGAYPGKTLDQTAEVVVGGGLLYHYLTTFGVYNDGLFIDYYGGAGSSYTGKHAVRHYDIVAPSITFNASEWVISTAGNMDMTPGSHRMDLDWMGINTEWRDTANWATSYVPDAGHNVYIENSGGVVPVISNADNAYCEDLTIGGVTPGLIIESDMTNGDGSLITFGTVSGNASVQRYLGADRWWYVSQPVTSAVAGVFLHTWMRTYNETANSWAPYIVPETTPLVPLQGYGVWTSSIHPWHQGWDPVGDTTVAYVGVLNTGPQARSLTFNIDGWNFTGNPYPSAADWEAFGWTKTGLVTNAFSVWTGSTYATYTAGGGATNGATRYIPAAQGFFVQTNAAGSLGFTDAVRVHSTVDFWKSDEIMLNRLSLTINNGQFSDETVIYFNENATTEIDYSYDAGKMIESTSPQAFTMLGENRMAINTFNNPGQTHSVNMGINAPAMGEYTITASNIESFDASTPIYLEDLLNGQYIDLRETSSYSFSADEGTSVRFVVHFTNTQGIDKPGSGEITTIYGFNGQIFVNFDGIRGEISIYNILGQEISNTAASKGLNSISVPQGNAVYIVKVISDNASVTKKVFVK